MEVHINEVVSRVRSVDGSAMLSPQVMRQIVAAVLEAVREVRDHERRARSDTQVGDGARDEE